MRSAEEAKVYWLHRTINWCAENGYKYPGDIVFVPFMNALDEARSESDALRVRVSELEEVGRKAEEALMEITTLAQTNGIYNLAKEACVLLQQTLERKETL